MGLSQRIVSGPRVPERQYSQLRSGVEGIVYYLSQLPHEVVVAVVCRG
jgi:hypothetical protein